MRAVAVDGSVRTVAGGGSRGARPGAPANAVALAAPTGVAVRGDGAFAFTEPGTDRVSAVREPLPGFGNGDTLIGSADGSRLFQFDPSGQHLRTLDALTGAVLRRFTYDAAGPADDGLRRRAGRHAALLTITRPDATTMVLTARGDRVTTLTLDANGWLASVTDPTARRTTLTHDANGLLRGEAGRGGRRARLRLRRDRPADRATEPRRRSSARCSAGDHRRLRGRRHGRRRW